MRIFKPQKNNHGVITIFISFMLVGIIGLSSLVIEGGRLQAAKTQLDEANGSAGYSMIAAYNSKLYDRFGILAIDNQLATAGRYRAYLDFNSDLVAPFDGNNISTLYTVQSAEMQAMYNLTYPSVLKRQILARAKFNVVPQDFVFNYYNMEPFLLDLQNKIDYISTRLAGAASAGSVNDIPADMRAAFDNLYEAFKGIKKYDEEYGVIINSTDKALLPSVTGSVESVFEDDSEIIAATVADAYSVLGSSADVLTSNGSETYNEIDASVNVSFMKECLQMASSSSTIVSKSRVIVEGCRNLVKSINSAFNVLKSDTEGNLLLNSYVTGYFSNKNFRIEEYAGPVKGTKGSSSNSTFVSSCTEYVFGGKSEETANQETAYDYGMAVRMINNLFSVLTGSKVCRRRR